MATVRMSQRLISDMVSTATRKYETQNQTKPFPATAGDDIVISEGLRDKAAATQKFMESTWSNVIRTDTDTVSSIYIKSTITKSFPDSEDEDEEHYQTYALELSTPLELPQGCGARYGSIDIHVKPDNEIFVQCYSIDQDNKRINNAQYDFRNSLRRTLEQFTTLNQALKASDGSYAALVPQETMTRVMQKEDRKQRNIELAEIAQQDISGLKEILLTDSLLGGDE